jgi:hypothetical protein
MDTMVIVSIVGLVIEEGGDPIDVACHFGIACVGFENNNVSLFDVITKEVEWCKVVTGDGDLYWYSQCKDYKMEKDTKNQHFFLIKRRKRRCRMYFFFYYQMKFIQV